MAAVVAAVVVMVVELEAGGACGEGGKSGVLLLTECLLSSVTSDRGDRGSEDGERHSDGSCEEEMASIAFGLVADGADDVQRARE